MKKKGKGRRKVYWGRIFFALAAFVGIICLTAVVLAKCFPEKTEIDDGAPAYVKRMFLERNAFSRPGNELTEVNDIVIHYVANPGTSAEANRNYFDNLRFSLRNPDGMKASAHYIVGLEGEVIQCIPMTEIAYANYPRNGDTVSVEVCHPDETGQFSETTYASVIRLTVDLCRKYGLTSEHVIRHYDVSGKACPKYYVEHEDAWAAFLADVQAEIEAEDEIQ